MSFNDSRNSISFANFFGNRVSRFGKFGLSKKYQRVLMTPLSDDQRKTVIDKLTKKGLQPQHKWNQNKYESPLPKKPDEFDRKKVSFQNHSRNSVYIDSSKLMEELLSSAPSSPTMSERSKSLIPGKLNLKLDPGQISDMSQSAPSSPSDNIGYYDTIPLLPECRDNRNEFFHPTNVPFKSFFPFSAIEPSNLEPFNLDDRSRFVIGSDEPSIPNEENIRVRSSRVHSLTHLMEKLQIKDLIPTFKMYGITDLRSFTKISKETLEKMQITNMEVKTKILTALELLSETEDSPEKEKTEKSKQIELARKSSISDFRFPSDQITENQMNQSIIRKSNPYHLSRSHRTTTKETKNFQSTKMISQDSNRIQTGHKKHQPSKRSGSSLQKNRSYQLQIPDLPCKETTIIHQHIHHHHHVGSSGFLGPLQFQWKLSDQRENEKLRLSVERKLQFEQINLTEIPYSDHKGNSGVPLRLTERYAYELDRDIRDVAMAIEASRSHKLLEQNRDVKSNMDAILSDQFLNCDGIKTESLESFLISIGLPMYKEKVKSKCRNLQTFLLYSDEALIRNFNIHHSHVRWIRREASFFPIGFLNQISHLSQQRFRTTPDAKYFALDRV